MIPPCARYVLLSSGFEARVSKVTVQPRFAAAHAAASPPRPLPITRTSVWIASLTGKKSCGLNLETQIYSGRGMRQCADRNPVNTCFGKFPHVCQGNSAGCFGANFSRGIVRSYLLDCLMYQCWIHVIEQDDVRIVRERGAQFVQIRHFNFHPRCAVLGGLRG